LVLPESLACFRFGLLAGSMSLMAVWVFFMADFASWPSGLAGWLVVLAGWMGRLAPWACWLAGLPDGQGFLAGWMAE
jgi:hypothetical protein